MYNEPTVARGQMGICTWEDWKKINEEMIAIIRGYGAKTIPLVAGFNWAYDLDAGKAPIEADGIAYVSHPYPMKKKTLGGQMDCRLGFMAAKYPLILTEIGFLRRR